MKKRYAITLDEEVHRKMTLKAVGSGKTVGDWLADLVAEAESGFDLSKWQTRPGGTKEVKVDDVKKAIEPEKVKESRGRLSKGLGDIPGQTEERVDPAVVRDPSFGTSRPAPKPGGPKKSL